MMKDPLREEDLSFAREEENKTKNRDSTIIPRKFQSYISHKQFESSKMVRLSSKHSERKMRNRFEQ